MIFYWNLELSHTETYTTQVIPLISFSSKQWWLIFIRTRTVVPYWVGVGLTLIFLYHPSIANKYSTI